MRALELLAPARNADIGIAAIDCGADAVYIAGPGFGARQAAGNSLEDIRRLCAYAHRFGVRIFITLNTMLYDTELADAYRFMLEAQDAGADAFIVQDLAVLQLAGGGPDGSGPKIHIPLHASTQCAIRTPEQARFYADLGFSRLVLERELTLDAIREIVRSTDSEIECFVHGALCVCYSGQCYLSEYLAGRSANRGACMQACRSRYDLTDAAGRVLVRDKALLSLKDLNLKDRIADLAEAGICSFKIEGRLKNSSYVRNIVRDYSLALDALVAAQPDRYRRSSFGRITGGFTPDPSKTFNRGYTDLFIDGRRSRGWAAMEIPKSIGEPAGTVRSVRPAGRDGMEILLQPAGRGLRLANGDGFCFVTDDTVTGFRGDVCEGLRIRCKHVEGLKPGLKLWRNISVDFEKELERNRCRRLIPVRLSLHISRSTGLSPTGLSPCFSGSDAGAPSQEAGFRIELRAETEDGRTLSLVRTAGQPLAEDAERMDRLCRAQLEKTAGDYRFRIEDIHAPEGFPLLPASVLNALRRDVAEGLDAQPCRMSPLRNIPLFPTSKTLPPRNRAESSGFSDDEAKRSSRDVPSGIPTDYKANVANTLAEAVYRAQGADPAPAYERAHPAGAELMRTKYCIRFELGLCPVRQGATDAGKLYLLNNGRRLALDFDCRACEMAVREG